MKFGHCIVALALAIASLGFSVGTSLAQTASPGRVPTVSRLVLQFTEREEALAARLRTRDAESAGRLLTDDFELRASPQPGRPVPRAEWLRQSLVSPLPQGAPTQMAVHDFGDSAVVSFLQPGDGASASLFVVDVWRRETETWKLAVRYLARSNSGSAPLPGVPPPEPAIPKKD